jgi:hypothetical protein
LTTHPTAACSHTQTLPPLRRRRRRFPVCLTARTHAHLYIPPARSPAAAFRSVLDQHLPFDHILPVFGRYLTSFRPLNYILTSFDQYLTSNWPFDHFFTLKILSLESSPQPPPPRAFPRPRARSPRRAHPLSRSPARARPTALLAREGGPPTEAPLAASRIEFGIRPFFIALTSSRLGFPPGPKRRFGLGTRDGTDTFRSVFDQYLTTIRPLLDQYLTAV